MTDGPPLDAVVFDCDGVLTDTSGLWEQAYTAFAAKYRIEIPLVARRRLAALGTAALGPALADLIGVPIPPGELSAEIVSLVGSNMGRPVSPMPGAAEVVTALAAAVPLAVASNSPAAVVCSHLSRTGLLPYFQVVVCIDDVAAPKPAPYLYQLACSRLGVPPQRSTAIEDSPDGVSSAAAAGLFVIGIQASGKHLDADVIYPSLTDLRLRQALNIGGGTRIVREA